MAANDSDVVRVRIHYARLKALLGQAEATRPENAEKPGRPATGVPPLIRHYNALLLRTREVFQDEPLVLEVVTGLQPVADIEARLASVYHMNAKQDMVFGLMTMLSAIEASMLSTTGAPVNVSVEREGLYVSGQRFDALLAAARIIAAAQTDIMLVDGYISDRVLSLMTGKAEAATARILTKPTGARPDLVALATAFNQQYGAKAPLSIRTSQAFHDRFLVIDSAEFYHFGASLKDLGTRGFMFSRIEERTVIDALQQTITHEWASATVVV